MTKHDILFWLKNASTVDSLIEIEPLSPNPSPTQIAECILHTHIQERLQNPDNFWKTIVTLGLLHSRQFGQKGLNDLKTTLIREFSSSDQEAVELALKHCQPLIEAYGDEKFEPFTYEDEEWSLLKDTVPQLRPEANSSNGKYQFHMKPSTALDALRQNATLPDWLKSLAASLKPSSSILNHSVEGS